MIRDKRATVSLQAERGGGGGACSAVEDMAGQHSRDSTAAQRVVATRSHAHARVPTGSRAASTASTSHVSAAARVMSRATPKP
jgi:hypothetical protein